MGVTGMKEGREAAEKQSAKRLRKPESATNRRRQVRGLLALQTEYAEGARTSRE